MALDIKEGDWLTVGSRVYPILSCSEWKWDYDTAVGGLPFADVSAGTMRALLDPATGKRGARQVYLTGLLCTPLDPQGSRLEPRHQSITGPRETLQTTVDGGDVFYALELEDLKP